MSPRRRSLLKAAGAVGLSGAGVAYWQRRQILRWDDLNAIETALEVPVLNVSDPVVITDNHIEASYSWARAHVDTTEDKLTNSEEQDSRHLQDAYEYLEGKSPEEIDDTGERHETLSDYRLAVASGAGGCQREESQLARAVMAQTSLATVAETLSEFENIPGWRRPGDVETELIEDTNELVNEKRTARREIETTANEVGSDPLGKHLLQQTVQRIEQADSSLDRLQDNFRSYDNIEWKRALDRVVMRYRSGAAEAAVIPDIVELVTSED